MAQISIYLPPSGVKQVSFTEQPVEVAVTGRTRAERWSDVGYASGPSNNGCGRLATIRPGDGEVLIDNVTREHYYY